MAFSLEENKNKPLNIIESLGVDAQKAARIISAIETKKIDDALLGLAENLILHQEEVLSANAQDVSAAENKNLSPALIDRLRLTPDRIAAMAEGIKNIVALPDPVGEVLEETIRPNGLKIEKVSVPIGVLGMIYESRPNVTIDAAALCLKSHNAVILRGGSESFHSSMALHKIIQEALRQHSLPMAAVSMTPNTDRALVADMLAAHRYIDVMIPRGGKGLTSLVMEQATMPVFAHLDGNCHIYVHPSAKADLALDVILNAKLRRTGICGATESLLFDKNLNPDVAHKIITKLLDEGCAVVGDEAVQKLDKRVKAAQEEDWSCEYLDKKISAKYIESVEDAVEHINHYGSHHTDAILAEDAIAVSYFQKNTDSAIVVHNASTQFADGGEFGMGAEIGIGTGKLHARGPVGLKQLTTFKYLLKGNGQTRPL